MKEVLTAVRTWNWYSNKSMLTIGLHSYMNGGCARVWDTMFEIPKSIAQYIEEDIKLDKAYVLEFEDDLDSMYIYSTETGDNALFYTPLALKSIIRILIHKDDVTYLVQEAFGDDDRKAKLGRWILDYLSRIGGTCS